eukprot:351487-Chlamydomonas_euryale.AAC.7
MQPCIARLTSDMACLRSVDRPQKYSGRTETERAGCTDRCWTARDRLLRYVRRICQSAVGEAAQLRAMFETGGKGRPGAGGRGL